VLEVTGLNPPLPPADVLVLEVGLNPPNVDEATAPPLDDVLVLEVGLKPPNVDEAAPLPDDLDADGWNPDFNGS
jgi:hypothetical protein